MLRKTNLEFMSHVIGADGVRPNADMVKAVVDSFLGVVNYMTKFVPHLTTVVRPIKQLVCYDIVWNRGPGHEEAMRKVKTKHERTCTASL